MIRKAKGGHSLESTRLLALVVNPVAPTQHRRWVISDRAFPVEREASNLTWVVHLLLCSDIPICSGYRRYPTSPFRVDFAFFPSPGLPSPTDQPTIYSSIHIDLCGSIDHQRRLWCFVMLKVLRPWFNPTGV